MKKVNSAKFAGKIILILGIAVLICGIVIFILIPSPIAFWTIVGSIVLNVIAISMLTYKPQ